MENESQRHRLERCQTDVEEHPERASAHYNLGLAYTVSGRVKQAEATYLKALEIDPTLVQAMGQSGWGSSHAVGIQRLSRGQSGGGQAAR